MFCSWLYFAAPLAGIYGCNEEKDGDHFAEMPKTRRQKLLCRSCTTLGRTIRDSRLYSCSACGIEKGRVAPPAAADSLQRQSSLLALPRRVLTENLTVGWLSPANPGSPSAGRRVPRPLHPPSLAQPSSASPAQLSSAKPAKQSQAKLSQAKQSKAKQS